ncbi:MAG: DUF1460 domain-containing protein [Candidatus Marinimicrobia bacterium]|nr:DUF1460 domain-containing protein [Candidatus Neomarinimicrobiota bacterium]
MKKIIFAITFLLIHCFAGDLRLMDMKPAEIDSLLRANAKKGLTISERIDLYSHMFLGTEYSWTPTGDGEHALYEPQPLFSFTQSNCMVLCEHSLALAISDSWDNFFNNLQQIRYRDGIIGIKTRNHYTMADWVPENRWVLDDVTQQVGENYTEKATRRISYSKFFESKKLADYRYIKPDEDITIDYIRWDDIPKIKKNISQGDIMAMILKDKTDIFSGHMILAVRVRGKLFIREASTSKMTTFETDFDEWAASQYAQKRYCGIIVTRVKENLNQKDAVILPWEIQDLKGRAKTNYYSPEMLIRDYLEKDARGEFLGESDWINGNFSDAEAIPAWDTSTLIESFRILDFQIESRIAVAKVEYRKLADILQDVNGFYLKPEQKVDTVFFELKQNGERWKIKKPIQNKHIFLKAIEHQLSSRELEKLSGR